MDGVDEWMGRVVVEMLWMWMSLKRFRERSRLVGVGDGMDGGWVLSWLRMLWLGTRSDGDVVVEKGTGVGFSVRGDGVSGCGDCDGGGCR